MNELSQESILSPEDASGEVYATTGDIPLDPPPPSEVMNWSMEEEGDDPFDPPPWGKKS